MTQPTNRDDLARHLYVHAHNTDGAQPALEETAAQEWDFNLVSDQDVKDCYARADEILAEGVTR